MAVISIDAFATKCNIERKNLMTYVGRGSVVLDGQMIDTNHEKNITFFNKRESKGLTTPKGVRPAKTQIPLEETYREPGADEEDAEEVGEDGIRRLDISQKRKLHFEAEVQERTVTLKELDIRKKSGESVPTSAVISLIGETLRMFAIGYRDLYEREVQKIASMAGFSAKEIADLRNSGINNINLIYDKAIEDAKTGISAIVIDHSAKRGVGEKT